MQSHSHHTPLYDHLDRLRTVFFYLTVLLFVFQDKLQEEIALFQYFDEGFALLALPLALLFLLVGKKPVPRTRENLLLFVSLAVFWACGWAAHFRYDYMPLSNALKDAYVNIKFFLAVGTGYLLFVGSRYDFARLKHRLWYVLCGASAVLFVLALLDGIFKIFSSDTRGGIPAVKLFYSLQTVLVGVCVFLASMLFWCYKEQGKKILLPLALLSCVMFSTLRVKAVGAISAMILVYLFVFLIRGKEDLRILPKKVKIFAAVFLLFSAVAGVYQIIRYYILLGVESARAVLTIAAPFAAWDHFPTGSGWATFGSAFSAEPYSPVYGMYRMAGIWGLSPGWHQFISDTYWPMVMAETGYFGFAALVSALVLLARKLWRLRTSPSAFAASAVPFLYLLVSSTSESAFANPLSVPLAFFLGILLAQHANASRDMASDSTS